MKLESLKNGKFQEHVLKSELHSVIGGSGHTSEITPTGPKTKEDGTVCENDEDIVIKDACGNVVFEGSNDFNCKPVSATAYM